jgi:Rieske Fe-S protein
MDDQRRKLCQVAGLTVLGAGLTKCGNGSNAPMDMGSMCNSTAESVGTLAADVPANSATFFMLQNTNVWLCRDDKGIYAMDAECTHLGCPAQPAGSQVDFPTEKMQFTNLDMGFDCHCHGATYDPNGQKPTAPAPDPLKHYLVCATLAGVMYVDTLQVVDPSTRYKP